MHTPTTISEYSVSASGNSLLDSAAAYILRLFQEKLPRQYSFHNTQHTIDVVNEVRRIAEAYDLNEQDTEILLLAAWFHDSGYTETYEGHEEASIRLAEEFLRSSGYPDAGIQAVCGCISATEMPQRPRNLQEEILCDADVANVGSDTFFDMSARLRQELQIVKGRVFTDEEWYEVKLNFCKYHQFHTEYARRHFSAKQAENTAKLERNLD